MSRPARVTIDLDALRHNLDRIRALAPGARVLAVVKADAYGHGLVRVARTLDSAEALGVACMEEAIRLREAGIDRPVVLLEGVYAAAELDDVRAHRFDLVVHHAEQIDMLEAAPGSARRLWLKIDTGMHRLGFAPAAVPSAHSRLAAIDGVDEIVLMSHFANTDQPGHASVDEQIAVFDALAEQLGGPQSLANSGAVLGWPSAHRDWVRPGLALYGASPYAGGVGSEHGLRPVMCLESRVIALRELAAGDPVGYGGTWRAPEPMIAGIVAIGYGDGYPRHADSGAPVIVDGVRSQVLGKSSMDMLCVDLRPVPEPRLGLRVQLWGPSLAVEELARFAGTIPYELMCNVKPRLHWRVEGER